MVDYSQVPDSIRLSIRSLPVLPAAVTRLLTLTQHAEISAREMASVIESDQTLMARTLRVANSSFYGTAREVKTAQQAIVLLGVDAIVNVVLGVSVASIQNSLHEQLPIDAEAFGRHSVAVAIAARKLARRFKIVHPGEAFVAGLLHDIGKLVLLMHYGDAYAQLMLRAHQGEKAFHELEKEAYDLDHALVGYTLCFHWNLPVSMAEAVAVHHTETTPDSLGNIVRKANNLVKAVQLGNSGNCYLDELPGTPDELMTSGWVRALILELQEEIQQVEDAFGPTVRPTGSSWARKPNRPLIQLQIANPEEQVVVKCMLVALGYEPITTFDAPVAGEGSRHPVAVITEEVPSDRQQQAYQMLDTMVLDYAAFRREHGITDLSSLDLARLWRWFSCFNILT